MTSYVDKKMEVMSTLNSEYRTYNPHRLKKYLSKRYCIPQAHYQDINFSFIPSPDEFLVDGVNMDKLVEFIPTTKTLQFYMIRRDASELEVRDWNKKMESDGIPKAFAIKLFFELPMKTRELFSKIFCEESEPSWLPFVRAYKDIYMSYGHTQKIRSAKKSGVGLDQLLVLKKFFKILKDDVPNFELLHKILVDFESKSFNSESCDVCVEVTNCQKVHC